MYKTGREFKQDLIENLKLNCDNLKLIVNGKLIRDESALKSQEIKVISEREFQINLRVFI